MIFFFSFLVRLWEFFFFFNFYFSIFTFVYFILFVGQTSFECCWGQTLPLINPRSCYCKRNIACAHMWAKRNGQSGQILQRFRWVMGFVQTASVSASSVCFLSLWMNECTERTIRSPPLATTVCLCLKSFLCKISQGGVLPKLTCV